MNRLGQACVGRYLGLRSLKSHEGLSIECVSRILRENFLKFYKALYFRSVASISLSSYFCVQDQEVLRALNVIDL
jgi:hypothetical protein